MAPADLSSKERSLFTQVVKHYENKQPKKGLKTAEQLLRKRPDHGDTIAMKALIINSQGNSEEAFSLAKTALQKSAMKSHVCWHVYGLLYRSNKQYDEAIKAYKMALRIEPDAPQIQKDLALLQMQMRDYPGYIQSRMAILQNKTMIRQNWSALAVAQHLGGDLWAAERTLSTFEDTLRSAPPRTDTEHAEAVLYKNSIIAEMGDTERALEHLESSAKQNPDRTWVMEKKAEYLLALDRKSEAETAYQALLDRNSEYRAYYEGLVSAKNIDESDTQSLYTFYEECVQKYPRADAPKRIPLDFLEGEKFDDAARRYLSEMLRKGAPSTFANIKALYSSRSKRDAVQSLVENFKEGEHAPQVNGYSNEKPDAKASEFPGSVHYFLAQHYNYAPSRDLDKAMHHIEEAIKTKPESVDYHQTKARIWKHHGNSSKAAETMEHARTLDTKDRYINTKAAKYQLRNSDNEASIQNMGKFTRSDAPGGPFNDLHDMQCQWYLYEDGMSYLRQGKLGLALKRFQSIFNTFEIWTEDQFDFHSFSFRKGQVRAYVDMIRWEDHLRDHPYFTRTALAASGLYVRIFDHPELANPDLLNGANGSGLDASELKKARKKARKEQERAAQAAAEKKDSKKPQELDANGEPKKEDKDPKGDLLLQTSDPLGETMKFVGPLLQYSPQLLEAQHRAFEVYLRRNKPMLALRSVLALLSVSPGHPSTHHDLIQLRHKLSHTESNEFTTSLSPKSLEMLESELSKHLPKDTDLTKFNNDYLQKHSEDASAVRAALLVRANILSPDSKAEASKDLIRTLALDSSDLKFATEGLQILKDLEADEKILDLYTAAARERYPEASAFKTEEKAS